jgi:hypothetical protein
VSAVVKLTGSVEYLRSPVISIVPVDTTVTAELFAIAGPELGPESPVGVLLDVLLLILPLT